jgi:choline kinase
MFLAQRVVGFEQVDDLPWTEIDFPEDLARAEQEILPRIVALDRGTVDA